jgi:peroxiredoxin
MMLLAAFLSVALAQDVPGPNLQPGDTALLFSLPALNEDAAMRAVARPTVALSDFTGVLAGFPARAVIVHFVQRSADAEAQLAALERVHRKWGPRGVRVLAVVDGAGDIASLSGWVEGQKLGFPVLRDAQRVVIDRYGVRAFPMTFVVDGQGYVDAIGVPKQAAMEAELEALLEPFVGR